MSRQTEKLRAVVMSGSKTGCRYALMLNSMQEVDLTLAVTGTDRPRGRGRRVVKCFVADFCDQKNLKAYQTDDINSPESVDVLRAAGADIAFVVDFGQILSGEVLGLFPRGCYNLHYSLLPELRGAAPVRWALIRGFRETGVTLISMSEKVDAGGMISSLQFEISESDDHESLKDSLTEMGLKLTGEFFRKVAAGDEIQILPQDASRATGAPKISGNCSIDWQKPAGEVIGLIRGMSPDPGCRAIFEKKNLDVKILAARFSAAPPFSPGAVSEVTKKSFAISASDGSVEIMLLQPAGKRPMTSAEFIAGNPVRQGDVFV